MVINMLIKLGEKYRNTLRLQQRQRNYKKEPISVEKYINLNEKYSRRNQ